MCCGLRRAICIDLVKIHAWRHSPPKEVRTLILQKGRSGASRVTPNQRATRQSFPLPVTRILYKVAPLNSVGSRKANELPLEYNPSPWLI